MQSNEEEIWSSIKENFEEFCDELRTIKYETREQAIKARDKDGKPVDKGTYWYDPDLDGNTRSWLQAPYNPAHEGLALEEKRDIALKLAEKIRPNIVDHVMTPEFILSWGLFCEYAGQWRMAYLQERPHLNHLQGGSHNSLNQHKIWYSKLYLHYWRANENRDTVDQKVIEHIYRALEKKPNGFPSKKWLGEILNFNGNEFRRAVRRMRFNCIKKTAQIDDPEIPNLGL